MAREPLPAIPRYDPNFDVVAHLPKDLIRRYRQMGRGLGNDTQQAKDNYYAICREDCGPYWRQFTREPKIVQMQDAQQRRYYMAFRDPGDPDPPALSEEEWDWLESGCIGPAPESLSKTHWRSPHDDNRIHGTPGPSRVGEHESASSARPSVAQRSSAQQSNCQSAYGYQRKEVDSHRAAETQSNYVGEGLVPSRSAEFDVAGDLTTAGGHKVRPYASFEVSSETTAGSPTFRLSDTPAGKSSLTDIISGQAVRCPDQVDASSPSAISPQPLAIPRWDPNYDVAAGLPPEIRQQHADKGEGIGNYDDEAIADYYAKTEAYCGGDWRRYTRPPRIVDGYDPQHREYCVAIPDYDQPLLQGLSDPDDVVGEDLAPSRSDEFDFADDLTTAGGHEVRPYASFKVPPEATSDFRHPTSDSFAGNTLHELEMSGQAVRCPAAGTASIHSISHQPLAVSHSRAPPLQLL